MIADLVHSTSLVALAVAVVSLARAIRRNERAAARQFRLIGSALESLMGAKRWRELAKASDRADREDR